MAAPSSGRRRRRGRRSTRVSEGDDAAVRARHRMVVHDIAARGVRDGRVLAVMDVVPRERFVPEDMAGAAYEDRPLPIAAGQTISQPYIVALMAQEARIGPTDRVLEVGTGSGYGAAVLSHLAAEVWTIERHEELARGAEAALASAGCRKVHVVRGDGSTGWRDAAPFDAIVVTAAAPEVPPALVAQLADGGRLVIPIGSYGHGQELVRVTRVGDRTEQDHLGDVRFVPLVGAQGYGRLRPAGQRRDGDESTPRGPRADPGTPPEP